MNVTLTVPAKYVLVAADVATTKHDPEVDQVRTAVEALTAQLDVLVGLTE